MTTLVVLDATLLVDATAFAGSSYRAWPDIPPITSNPEADCVGAIASSERHEQDVGLVLDRPLLTQVDRTLETAVGLRRRDIDAYLLALLELTRRSGGRILDDSPSRTALPPHLDAPLSLAMQAHAVVVAAHRDLRRLGPAWVSGDHSVPLLGPREFSVRVDAARRARRRNER